MGETRRDRWTVSSGTPESGERERFAVHAVSLQARLRREAFASWRIASHEFDDLFQEAVLRGLKTRGRMPGGTTETYAWMRRVIRNELLRRRGTPVAPLTLTHDEHPSPFSEVDPACFVAEALTRLGEETSRTLRHDPVSVVKAVLLDSRPPARVAFEHGVSLRTVRKDVARFRALVIDAIESWAARTRPDGPTR